MEKPKEITIDRAYIETNYTEEQIRRTGELYPNRLPDQVSRSISIDPEEIEFDCESVEEFFDELKEFFGDQIKIVLDRVKRSHEGIVASDVEPCRIEFDWDGDCEYDLTVYADTLTDRDRQYDAGILVLIEEEQIKHRNRLKKYENFVREEERQKRNVEREHRELRILISKYPEVANTTVEEVNNGQD